MIESTASSWNSIWNTYDKRTYDYQLAVEEHSVRWQEIERIIMRLFGSFDGLHTIEIGAGSGHYSMLFARRGAHVTMLDYSPAALEFCSRVFGDCGIDMRKTRFIQMDALNMNVSLHGVFDVSMSFGVAEHFRGSERSRIIGSHCDVLREGGVTFISVPHANCIPFKVYQSVMRLKKRHVIECYPYTKNEFRTIVSDKCFREVDFIGSSYRETYNPLSFYRRRKGIVADPMLIKKEIPSIYDRSLGREITFVGIKTEMNNR